MRGAFRDTISYFYKLLKGSGGVVPPSNAWVDEFGDPWIDEFGEYWLSEDLWQNEVGDDWTDEFFREWTTE